MDDLIPELERFSAGQVSDEAEELIDRAIARIKLLEEDSRVLGALRAGGVDNWAGWDDAMELLDDE